MGNNFGVHLPGIFLSLLSIIIYSLKGFSKLLGIGLNNYLYLVLLLGLLLNSYLGLGELIAQPYGLGLMVLIELVNGLLPFLSNLGIYGNVAPTLAHKGIECFLGSGLEGHGIKASYALRTSSLFMTKGVLIKCSYIR